VALRDIGRDQVLAAIAEYDQLGQDEFLSRYGFKEARAYRLVHEGKSYDSKAIIGVAHRFLPGQQALEAEEFSGGEANVARRLRRLGFVVQVDSGPVPPPDNSPGLAPEQLDEVLASLDVDKPSGIPRLYQPITLLWAFGRARQEAPRLIAWDETERSLHDLFARFGRPGEDKGRAAYPAAALYRAGLWELGTGDNTLAGAHGSLTESWFRTHKPRGGLVEPIYGLVRDSPAARFAAVETLVTRYFAGADFIGLLAEVGLTDPVLPAHATSVLPDSPAEARYRLLYGIASQGRNAQGGERTERTVSAPVRSAVARDAVIARSRGRCENPRCTGDIQDKTPKGAPILQVDHIHDLAKGGPDDPIQMIALCPNCHAIKTYGSTSEELRKFLLGVARRRHEDMFKS
jgi:5-methylcytosine-specific restriction protein A